MCCGAIIWQACTSYEVHMPKDHENIGWCCCFLYPVVIVVNVFFLLFLPSATNSRKSNAKHIVRHTKTISQQFFLCFPFFASHELFFFIHFGEEQKEKSLVTKSKGKENMLLLSSEQAKMCWHFSISRYSHFFPIARIPTISV